VYNVLPFKEDFAHFFVTSKPIDVLSHPKFQQMIQIALRAPNGIKIPEKRVIQGSIIGRVWKNIHEL
jgi:hypothetical protein